MFAGYLHWLPSGGAGNLSAGWGAWASHLVLPTATLTFALIAHVSRMTRSSMLETLRSPYVLFARAKGLPERVVLVRHALRNALLPTITVLAHRYRLADRRCRRRRDGVLLSGTRARC